MTEQQPLYQPPVPPQAPLPRLPKNNKKTILIVVGVIVGLLVISGILSAGCTIYSKADEAQDHAITFAGNYANYDFEQAPPRVC